jgi:hypothetical protein
VPGLPDLPYLLTNLSLFRFHIFAWLIEDTRKSDALGWWGLMALQVGKNCTSGRHPKENVTDAKAIRAT